MPCGVNQGAFFIVKPRRGCYRGRGQGGGYHFQLRRNTDKLLGLLPRFENHCNYTCRKKAKPPLGGLALIVLFSYLFLHLSPTKQKSSLSQKLKPKPTKLNFSYFSSKPKGRPCGHKFTSVNLNKSRPSSIAI